MNYKIIETPKGWGVYYLGHLIEFSSIYEAQAFMKELENN